MPRTPKRTRLPDSPKSKEGASKKQKTTASETDQQAPEAPPSLESIEYYTPKASAKTIACGLQEGYISDAQGPWVEVLVLRRAQAMGFRGVPPYDTPAQLGIPIGEDPISTIPVFMQKQSPPKPKAGGNKSQLQEGTRNSQLEEEISKESHNKLLGNKKLNNGVYLAKMHKRTRCGQFAIPMVNVFLPEAVLRMKKFVSTTDPESAAQEIAPKAEDLQAYHKDLYKALVLGRPPPFPEVVVPWPPMNAFEIDRNEVEYETLDPFYLLEVFPLTSETFSQEIIDAVAELISCFPDDHLTMDVAMWAYCVWISISLDEPPDEQKKKEIEESDDKKATKEKKLTAGYDREEGQSGLAKNKPVGVPPVELAVFIVYFPHFLRYHEVKQLAFYHHPFRWVHRAYTTDLVAEELFKIEGKYPEELEKKIASDSVFFRGIAVKKSATPPHMKGSGLFKWSSKCGLGASEHYVSADLFQLTKLPDIRTMGVPHYNQNRLITEGGDPFIRIAYPREWISPVFRGALRALPGEPRVPMPQDGPWEEVSPLPIMTTQTVCAKVMPSRKMAIEIDAAVSADKKADIEKKAPRRPWVDFPRLHANPGCHHNYIDEENGQPTSLKMKTSTAKPKTPKKAIQATSQVLDEAASEASSTRTKKPKGPVKEKPKPFGSGAIMAKLAAEGRLEPTGSPPFYKELSPRAAMKNKPPVIHKKCSMFPGMEPMEAGQILAPWQLDYVETRLGKCLKILKEQGLVDQKVEVDSQMLLKHPVLEEYQDLDEHGDEWAPAKGPDENAKGEAAAVDPAVLKLWQQVLAKLEKNNPRGALHPKLEGFRSFFNEQYNGGPKTSVGKLNTAFVESMRFFVRADYFRHYLKKYLHCYPSLYLFRKLTPYRLACHLLEWAHYQGPTATLEKLDLPDEDITDADELLIEGVDSQIAPILEDFRNARKRNEARRAKVKPEEQWKTPEGCGALEARKKSDCWSKLEEFYQRWGDPTTMELFQDITTGSLNWLREVYEELDDEFSYEGNLTGPGEKMHILRLDGRYDLQVKYASMRVDHEDTGDCRPIEEFVELDGPGDWVLEERVEDVRQERKEAGAYESSSDSSVEEDDVEEVTEEQIRERRESPAKENREGTEIDTT